MLADGTVGPSLLYGALADVVSRLAESGVVMLVLDDAHLGGLAVIQWIEFIRRRRLPLMVLATVRTPAPLPIADAEEIALGPLDYTQARELVGAARADALYARSGGHPLFLTELARATSPDDLPESLVQSVSARCESPWPRRRDLAQCGRHRGPSRPRADRVRSQQAGRGDP